MGFKRAAACSAKHQQPDLQRGTQVECNPQWQLAVRVRGFLTLHFRIRARTFITPGLVRYIHRSPAPLDYQNTTL